MPVSEDTKSYLDQVKKGKPRKFVLLTAGAKVTGLVLYKSGSPNKHITAAKREGAGVACYGVADGKGQDINFKLATSDGFKSAPVTNAALKSFLKDEADFPCKPIFEIVEVAPLVFDEEHPLVIRFRKLQDAAFKAGEAYPDRAREIGNLSLQIGRSFDQDQQDKAGELLESLERLLGSLARPASPEVDVAGVQAGTSGEGTNVTNDEATASPERSNQERRAELAEALKKLKPLIDKAANADPDRKAELFQSIAQIASQIKQDAFNDAKAGLVTLGRLAQTIVTMRQTSNANELAQAVERFDSSKSRIEPLLLDACRANPDKATAWTNVWNYALDQGEAGNYANALAAFERLEAAINKTLPESKTKKEGSSDGSSSNDTSTPDRVDESVTDPVERRNELLATWADRRTEVIASINRLADAFRDSDHPKSKEGVSLLQEIIGRIIERPETRQLLGEMMQYLESEEAVAEAELPNPFGFKVSIRAPLLAVATDLDVVLT